MRFWKVRERIVRGVKRVGGFSLRAVPAGGDCAGVKYCVSAAGVFRGAIIEYSNESYNIIFFCSMR